MDDEPHYSGLFSNEYCRAYLIELGRLEQTKSIAHQRNWVWIPLAGQVQEASGGTVYQDVYDPMRYGSSYLVHFRWPVKPYSLRNDHMERFQGIVVEIMAEDDSRNRWDDPSLDHTAEFLPPGDKEKTYITSLVKTNVEIDNIQLMSGTGMAVRGDGSGQLLVAMTDIEVSRRSAAHDAQIQLNRGQVTWLQDAATATYNNVGRSVARFVLLQIK